MKYSFTIYPNLITAPGERSNPYIRDFIAAINKREDSTLINLPNKNPLLDILKRRNWGKTFIFNWYESIPDYKYGLLQAMTAIALVSVLKICGRKIVWVFHNKHPHIMKWGLLKNAMSAYIARCSNLIVTHASEGVNIIKERYPYAKDKVIFLHHPTKNRLSEKRASGVHVEYDLLIWGTVSRYKGVLEFVDFMCKNNINDIRVCIVGACSSPDIAEHLKSLQKDNITYIDQRPSFEELCAYSQKSHFIFAPFASESVLSSGTLMDSLSFGARVIGPDTGSFNDYSHYKGLNVYTFSTFHDVVSIVHKYKDTPVSLEAYANFLERYNWDNFIAQLIKHLP